MAVLITFNTVAMGITKLITTFGIRGARGAGYTKAAAANTGVAMTGGEAFYALAFRGITIPAGTIGVRTTRGAFDAHVGVGITDQTVTAVTIAKTGDTLIGA